MADDNNSLKWLYFLVISEDFPTCSTRFNAIIETKGLSKTVIRNEDRIIWPNNLPEHTSNEHRVAPDAQQTDYTIKIGMKENRNKTV